jgi:hypothetical protein
MKHLHMAAIIIALVSGSYTLVALAVGSPLEVGVGLVLSGASWLAAHYMEWLAEREARARRRPVRTAMSFGPSRARV